MYALLGTYVLCGRRNVLDLFKKNHNCQYILCAIQKVSTSERLILGSIHLNRKTFGFNLGRILPYMGNIGMCRCGGYGFQEVFSGMGYINQRVWVQNRVSFSRKLIKWLKILDQGNRELPLKNIKKSNRFCFGWTVLVTSVVSEKQLLQDRGEFGEFTLVQGSKIQLNQLWYRLRVPGSQRHIPTQTFSKVPPGVSVVYTHSQNPSSPKRLAWRAVS